VRRRRARTARRWGERGHLMVGLVAAIAILLILSTVAVQAWKDRLRRDNEAEMIFRAQEIVRAIARFQKANSRLPLKLDELMEPGPKGQYFLRHMYKDPLVKGGKWGLLYSAPGGGVLDPNSPGLNADAPVIGTTTNQPFDPQGALTPGLGGQQATGLPIIGVKSLCKDRPFRVYKDQKDYTLWLFSILDLQAQNPNPNPNPNPPNPPPGQ
jgi:type II secretory pathway pseudopilin PulG